ncbi:MAG TPA: peroxidase-related enzyme [Puia sp.]|nr:peroxidase-related enzyme [Puia sp.]
MPYIEVNNDFPGIRGLMAFRPEAARPLGALANILLRDTEGLSPAERELIATRVSYLNDCFYCHNSHGEIACVYLDGDRELVDQVRKDPRQAPISGKLKALLNIAGKVQKSGKAVLPEDIAAARAEGATDREIHDTVLIAAAFCLFNRYVDGLGATTPTDLSTYPPRARQIAETGYGNHIFSSPQPH